MSSASDKSAAVRLRRAIRQGELALCFQPKIDVASGCVAGVEAVCRWYDPGRGEVPPADFIPLAERSGLIDGLTDWVIGAALRQWAAWREQGIELRLALNVSALSLRDVTLPDRIERLCMQEGMPTQLLTIEVTESATQSVVCLLDTLTRFRLKAISVSLDDFGTGYSSLAQLRQLPYSEIKIDRCFVRDIATSRESRLIVAAIVGLAHGLGLTATAEGVEDQETLEMLREFGCDEAQGFLIARPMSGGSFVPWLLRSGRHLAPAAAAKSAEASCSASAAATTPARSPQLEDAL